MKEGRVTENRLARETSPYLLQHAHNPVDWYPWGEEAFARARAEDKPLLLSVGYSACHWCHVMERESFEDPEIAALMNRHFVSVKVDREERPDVDQIYMQAVQSMTGHGGWPMTCFLTPDGEPFYGGTYFPPVERHGLPAFPRLLQALADAWANRRGEVTASARQIGEALAQSDRLRSSPQLITDEILFGAFQALSAQFDEADGGLGGAPKFPQPMIWEFVLRFWRRSKNARARQMVHTTLTTMARGGIYDQVGGGFHRYSVDAHWLVPHFEKMLYDNGQLASLYLHGWLAFGDPECRRITEETLDYILREMTDPAGGFYSAQDADSEGHEGKFFVWSMEELREALGEADARAAAQYWGVDRGPNFEGKNILSLAGAPDPERIAPSRKRLYETRERRVHPGLDDKVLAAWNGLACRAFAEAGRALGRPDYVAAAVKNAEFVLGAMRPGGRYDTGGDHERLIVRPRNLFDNAVPCGSSVAIETLLRLAILTGESSYETAALKALRPMADLMARHASGFGRFLCALDFHLGPVAEVALVAPPGGNGLAPLTAEVFGRYLPNRVVAGIVAGDPKGTEGIPLLQNREAVGGRPTAYVCRNYACELPVTDRDSLARQLDAV